MPVSARVQRSTRTTLSIREAAQISQLTPEYVRKLLRDGRIQGVLEVHGRMHRCRPYLDSLQAYMATPCDRCHTQGRTIVDNAETEE